MMNLGGCLVGLIIVGCFLLCFIKKYNWVYFDIVGMVWCSGKNKGVIGCLVFMLF